MDGHGFALIEVYNNSIILNDLNKDEDILGVV